METNHNAYVVLGNLFGSRVEMLVRQSFCQISGIPGRKKDGKTWLCRISSNFVNKKKSKAHQTARALFIRYVYVSPPALKIKPTWAFI